MRKILAIAQNEYRQVVFTKSFIISLLFPVLIYGMMFGLSIIFKDKTDVREREFVVVDYTGELYDSIEEAATERNKKDIFDSKGRQTTSKFIPREFDPEGISREEILVQLSDEVRSGDLFAFVLIGEDYLPAEGGERDYLDYFSDSPTYENLPRWIRGTVEDSVETIRFDQAGVDQRAINLLISHNSLERFKLAEVDEDGNMIQPKEENELISFLVPFAVVMLVFFGIQMSTPILLNTVIEEKMQRISEVLLSSVTPIQLLSGKLIAGVGVGLTFTIVYLASMHLSLGYFNYGSYLSSGLYFWFIAFLLTGLLSFGSMFAALSSACQDLRDSQNFAGTVVILLVIPMVLSMVAIGNPDGPLAKPLSFIPLFSPMTMLVRVAIPPGPALWEPLLALFVNGIFTLVIVWLAARIFRIGILASGKTPTLGEVLGWMFRKD